MLLETGSEQLRLLEKVPEVIAALENCDPTPSQDKQAYNGCSESAPEEFPQTPSTPLANETSCFPNGTDPAGSQVSQEINLKSDLEVTAAKCKRKQTPSNFEQSSSIYGEPWTKKVPTIDNLTQFPCIPADETAEPVEARGELQTVICDSIHEDNIIVLSDDDEDAPQLEVPGSDLWYWMGPLLLERGPYKMSLLKEWVPVCETELRSYKAVCDTELRSYKAWKEGQSNDRNVSSVRSSPRNVSDDDTGAVGTVHPTLPGLINEIMSKGRRMTYEELCNAVMPQWHNLRKHNGERYAYTSPSQAVLDCLRNRHEWARLVDRGPKTNPRKKRKLDADDSEDNEYGRGNHPKELEGKSMETQREDFPKGKRKARKRRRLALQGRGMKDVREKRKADLLTDEDVGPSFSNSTEETLSEDDIQGGERRQAGSEASSSSEEEGTS